MKPSARTFLRDVAESTAPASSRISQKTLRVYGIAIVLLIFATVALLLQSPYSQDHDNADIKNEWVLGRALISGDDPYKDLVQLSARYTGSRYRVPDPDPSNPDLIARTPRLPGALVLALPISLVPFDQVAWVNAMVQVACAIGMFLPIYSKTKWPQLGIWTLGTLASAPFLWQMRWGNVAPLVALLAVSACVISGERDSRLAGVLLGIAASLKAYPLILIALLASRRRWRAVAALLVTLLLLNGPLLFMPSISPSDALDAVLGAAERYAWIPVNLSLPHAVHAISGSDSAGIALFVALVAGSMLWVWTRPTTTATDSLFLLAVGTLASPISWPLYLLALFPLVAWVCHSADVPLQYRVALAVAAVMTFLPEMSLLWFALLVFTAIPAVLRIRRPVELALRADP